MTSKAWSSIRASNRLETFPITFAGGGGTGQRSNDTVGTIPIKSEVTSLSRFLRKQPFYDFPVNIGQSKIPPLIAKGQLFMLNSK